MSGRSIRRKDGLGVLGVGAAACAACCAGPIIGVLSAIGVGTAAGIATFGLAGLLVAVVGVAFVLRRRARRRQTPCPVDAVPVELGARAVRPGRTEPAGAPRSGG